MSKFAGASEAETKPIPSKAPAPIEALQSSGHVKVKPGPEPIDWAYWLKLPEVKVFEAIALMFDTEPDSEPPDEDASPEYRRTLRLLVACLSDRSTFTAGTLNMGDPALHGVRLPEVGVWAIANDYTLPDKFPRSVKLNHAQPRNTPALSAIDWPFWKAMRSVKLWQACALITGIDPDSLKRHAQAWMAGPGAGPIFDKKCFPNAGVEARFEKSMRLADTAVSYMHGPIFPQGTPRLGSKLELDVLLSEVAAFFRSIEWTDIPAPMQSIGISPASVAPQLPNETKEKRQDRRLNACIDGGLTMDKAARFRLPDGVGDIADKEGITRQAFSTDVKAALTRRFGP